MVALPALILLGSLLSCSHAVTHMSAIEAMKAAALKWKGPLACDKWDCDCAFTRQRGCCCAANELFKAEDHTFTRMMDLWYSIKDLLFRVVVLTETTKIAFKATMMEDIAVTSDNCFGPFNTNVSLPFGNVSLNDGNGYNAALGIFTAPHPGVYVFSFTVYSHVEKNERLYHKVMLMKNGEYTVSVWESNREDMEDSATQRVLLEMERGDQAYLELLSGRKLCKYKSFNIFTGYMLYPHTEEMPEFKDM